MSTWYITLKDLLLLTCDKQALVLLLVLPLVLISIIGMSTGQFLTTGDDVERIKVVIVDESKDATSKSFIADLNKRPELLITIADAKTKALETLRRGDAMRAMFIGMKFAKNVGIYGADIRRRPTCRGILPRDGGPTGDRHFNASSTAAAVSGWAHGWTGSYRSGCCLEASCRAPYQLRHHVVLHDSLHGRSD